MSLSDTQSSAFLTGQPHAYRKQKATAIAIALSTLSQIACASSTFAQDGSSDSTRRGGIIRYGHFQEPPCLFGGWVQQWYLQRQYSDNLVARTKDGEIVPWLATSWTISDDKKVYTFEIKPNVKFTDGTPLDAQAVADNINGWLSNNPDLRNPTAAPYLSDNFESAAAIAPATLATNAKGAVPAVAQCSRPVVPGHSVANRAQAWTCGELREPGRIGSIHRPEVESGKRGYIPPQSRLQLGAGNCQAPGTGLR
ncbi:hypothetical protein ACVWWR_008826 [Bradyrhizobium sp. LM3.2]